ncbi:TetR/AcrR family transcriptional regulator [Paraburkholderia jirisanensis]
MKKSKVETAETRQRIIDVAAREFRLNGIRATGLNDLMSAAGLTRGGFYRHFESKDHLVAEACAAGVKSIVGVLEDAASDRDGADGFLAIVERYVSTAHRDNSVGGCPLAAMGSELARADDTTRTAASDGLNKLVDVIAKRLIDPQSEDDRSQAVFALAAMIGAVTMSRIAVDRDASALILQQVKQHLEALPAT